MLDTSQLSKLTSMYFAVFLKRDAVSSEQKLDLPVTFKHKKLISISYRNI